MKIENSDTESVRPGSFNGYAIVEMMGHQEEVGFLTTEAYGVSVLFRIDIPELPAEDEILTKPTYGPGPDGHYQTLPIGSKFHREATPPRTRLISPAAIYAINPCSEEAAKAALRARHARPLVCIELPPKPALPAGQTTATPEHDVYPEGEREFECCGNTPEQGHVPGCSGETDDLEESTI